jgi:hypothetical protein
MNFRGSVSLIGDGRMLEDGSWVDKRDDIFKNKMHI